MRTDSIYEKLQRADQTGGTTYFLDLMIYLEEAEGDRFGKAAQMISENWGFKTSKTALWNGYDEAHSAWRLGRARSFAMATEAGSAFDKEQARVIAQQSFVLLANPKFVEEHPEILLGFAKLEVEKIKADATIRRVALLEKKIEDAKQEITKASNKGGLTPETLAKIREKLDL